MDIVYQDFFDFNEWLDEDLTNHKINYGGDAKLDGIQNAIIEKQSAAYAYVFASSFNYKTYKMQDVVLSNQNSKYLFLFARYVKNADIKALQKALLKSVDPDRLKHLCKFVCHVPGANKRKIEDIIAKESAEKKQARYAHMYIKNVKGADIKKFKKTIIASGKPRYLYWVAKHLKTRKEVAQIERLIIETKSFMYVRLMAKHIPHANLNKLEQFVLDSGNVKEIKKFAKAIKKSKSRHLAILF